MKTLEQIKKYTSIAIDGRDVNRLADFIPENMLKDFGLELKEELKGKHKPEELTKENILIHLKNDVAFAFEKALNKRGISSSCMFAVVKMWNWILEEGLENWNEDEYAQYGLPLFKATAVKYGFENPIGENKGNEDSYGDEEEN